MTLIKSAHEVKVGSDIVAVAYDTNFVDYLTDSITIYLDFKKDCYTDMGYISSILDSLSPSWREKGTVEKICERYNCKISGENGELTARHDSQLIQAIISINAWIEFREDKQ